MSLGTALWTHRVNMFSMLCSTVPHACDNPQVRFFGKFLGTHADYYVFETTLKSAPEEPEQQLGEHRKQLC